MRRLLLSFGVVAAVLICAGPASAAIVPGRYIVVLKDSVGDPVAVKTKHEAKGAKIAKRYRHALKGYSAALSSAALTQVRSDPAVQFVAAVRTRRLPKLDPPKCCRAASQDPQTIDTSVDRIDGEASSTRSGDGRGNVGVNVAVVDTGVDPRHPELNVAGGHSCVGDNPRAWQDDDAEFGHGTAVAGLIGSQDNPIAEVGVAPGARIWAVKVFDSTGFAARRRLPVRDRLGHEHAQRQGLERVRHRGRELQRREQSRRIRIRR